MPGTDRPVGRLIGNGKQQQEPITMPIILWLLGVPLSLVIILLLVGVI